MNRKTVILNGSSLKKGDTSALAGGKTDIPESCNACVYAEAGWLYKSEKQGHEKEERFTLHAQGLCLQEYAFYSHE